MNSQSQEGQKDQKKRPQLREIIGYIAEFLTLIGVVVYGSGFVIVNAYLSQKGVSNVRLLHAAFIPPGILFFLLMLWAASLSALAYFLSKKSLLIITSKWELSFHLKERDDEELEAKKTIGKTIIQGLNKIFNLHNIITFICYLLILIFAIIILGSGILLVSLILSLASPIIIIDTIDFAIKILPVMILLAVFAGLVGYNYKKWDEVMEQELYYIPSFSVLVIIVVLLYSLYHVAGQIYGILPPSVGGGAPEEVILFVSEENKTYFDTLGIDLCEIDVEITDEGQSSYGSNLIWWYWQFSDERRFGTSGDAPTAILYMTLNVENGPIIAIQGEMVKAVKFWPSVEANFEYVRCN
jgi:hypothetical protein